MEKVLVTGGSGFIGTNLIESLKSTDYEILNIDIHSPKIEEHKKYWKKIDIRDYDSLSKEICKFMPDYIIDLAAKTDLKGKSIDDYNTNTIGKKNILKICESITIKKYIMVSSMLVCKAGYQPTNQKDYCATTLYGESKAIAEKYIWESNLNSDWCILRPTSIWGPWFSTPYKDFFDRVIRGSYFHIGNRSCTKTYGYIGNSVYQIKELLKANTNNRDNKVFYIGDYEPYPIEQWANEIADECRKKIIKLPFFLLLVTAWIGDLLKSIGIAFPMTSFRLRNMTTNNIVDLSNTKVIAPELPYTRQQGIHDTLKWIERTKNDT